jgi:glycerol-3-phosphate acyltransferase PlsY
MILASYLILAYLLGAFPSSVVLGRLIWKTDVRRHGSGNAGATNAWRVLGWKAGTSVLTLDVAKGVLASAAIPRIPLGPVPLDGPTLAVLCGLTAVLGHVFPVYLRFRGGKGIATAAGMLVASAPIPTAYATAIFVVLVFLFGRISLGSIIAAWTVPVSALLLRPTSERDYPPLLLGLTFALAVFVLYTHRANIVRLIRGEERTFPQLQLWKRMLRR